MLDQLVESKSHEEENLLRSGLLLVTFIIVSSLFLGGLVYSLFAKELGLSDEGLVLTTLVAPPLPEEAPPPPPEPEQKQEKQTAQKETDVTIVKQAYATIEATKEPPKDVLGQKDVMAIRPGERFKIGTENVRASSPSTGIERGEGGGGLSSAPPIRVDDEEAPPPPPKPSPTKTPPKVVSKGVINGEAISLPQPQYPPAAKAVRISGDVTVQVTIDEQGNVISAVATSGHQLLRAAAVDAAKRAKFRPTLLSGVPVKVTGIITYKFILQ
ncbi:MAG: energy transducer TonB [Pyrinomonadaceae bacterium]|nr:energy transducer TonB [Pyrinomonadaceae bacterium]MCX7640928.1 energy transducer TonB [Pyrinomonadaceae bacterium]MDW8304710.1 energy transducer TonB [Acidobacteriota bacterium]